MVSRGGPHHHASCVKDFIMVQPLFSIHFTWMQGVQCPYDVLRIHFICYVFGDKQFVLNIFYWCSYSQHNHGNPVAGRGTVTDFWGGLKGSEGRRGRPLSHLISLNNLGRGWSSLGALMENGGRVPISELNFLGLYHFQGLFINSLRKALCPRHVWRGGEEDKAPTQNGHFKHFPGQIG